MNRRRPVAALVAAVALIPVMTVDDGPVSATGQDGSRIVWSENNKDFTNAQIVSADPDGRHLRRLSNPGPHDIDIDAAISPDGRQIVFERDASDILAAIVLMDARGRHEHVIDLGCVDPCVTDLAPGWTPDGKRITFSRVIGPLDPPTATTPSAVLYTAKPDGTDIQRLSESGIEGVFEDYGARYAPDGSYLTFLRLRSADLTRAIFRMDADRTHIRQLTPWELDADGPKLSPATHGPTKDLVVFETPHGPPDGLAVEIATVPTTCPTVEACAGQITFLTSDGTGPAQNFNPTWSPDGRRIAYVEYLAGDETHPRTADIWTIRANGRDQRQVTTSRRSDFRPAWGFTT